MSVAEGEPAIIDTQSELDVQRNEQIRPIKPPSGGQNRIDSNEDDFNPLVEFEQQDKEQTGQLPDEISYRDWLRARKHHQNAARKWSQSNIDDDEDDFRSLYRSPSQWSSFNYQQRQRQPDYRRRNQHHRMRQPIQPIVNIDAGLDENPDENQLSYPASYNEVNFNQIQSADSARRYQNRIRPSQSSPAIRRFEPGTGLELHCADCQRSTLRLVFRQFCQLEYAIKASIIDRQVSDDWTKFEVEIQDIFKSPNEDSRSSLINSNFIASGEDPSKVARSNLSQLMMADSGEQQSTLKLKIGSIQSIWVPTEDLSCKCPKLKLRSTYLLMGKFRCFMQFLHVDKV